MSDYISPKKRWFDVPDSKSKGDDGKAFYNVEARFADHPVIDVAESRKAGHSVYKLVPQLHMHVKKNIFGNRSIKNSTSVVFRFDKGKDETAVTAQVIGPTGAMVPNREGKPGMSKPDFDRAISLILRCREAWEHYQSFREAPVWPLEEEAVRVLAHKPKTAKGVQLVVGRDGSLAEYEPFSDDEDESFDPDGDMPEDIVLAPLPVPVKKKPGRPAKVA